MTELFVGRIASLIYPKLIDVLESTGESKLVVQLHNPKQTVPGELSVYPWFILCLQLGLQRWTGKQYSQCIISYTLDFNPKEDQLLFVSPEYDDENPPSGTLLDKMKPPAFIADTTVFVRFIPIKSREKPKRKRKVPKRPSRILKEKASKSPKGVEGSVRTRKPPQRQSRIPKAKVTPQRSRVVIEETKHSEGDMSRERSLELVELDVRTRLEFARGVANSLSSVNKVYGENCIQGAKPDLLQKMELVKYLKSGSFGAVYEGCAPLPCDQDAFKFAIKLGRISKRAFNSPFSEKNWEWREALILTRIIRPLLDAHVTPNLPLLYDIFTCNTCSVVDLAGKIFKTPCQIQLLEFATGGDLAHWIRTAHTAEELNNALFQIMAGLEALQTHAQMVTNDIKTENILCYNVKPGGFWEYKIGDRTFFIPNLGTVFIVNDFGVSIGYSPNHTYMSGQDPQKKLHALGIRAGMIISGAYTPLDGQCMWRTTKKGPKQIKPGQLAWGTPIKNKSKGKSPLPFVRCQALNVTGHSTTGSAWINTKNDKIYSADIKLTKTQREELQRLNIPADSSAKEFYEHPNVLPPLELRWDTQDAIRMFTGGPAASQEGPHDRYDSKDPMCLEWLNRLDTYVFNVSTQYKNRTTDKKICDGLVEDTVGTMSTYPAMDLARYFIYDFFTSYYTRPTRGNLIDTYKSE
jgi:hypothetical protein